MGSDGSDGSDGERRGATGAKGSDGELAATRLLLCGLVPNRPQTADRGWGALV